MPSSPDLFLDESYNLGILIAHVNANYPSMSLWLKWVTMVFFSFDECHVYKLTCDSPSHMVTDGWVHRKIGPFYDKFKMIGKNKVHHT